MKLTAENWHDTAGSARHIAELKDPSVAAIASSLAGRDSTGSRCCSANVEDEPHNMTRFLIMAHEPDDAPNDGGRVITTFVFRVRNVPAALYKAMGGFATNGVNMTKLESYQLGGSFNATQFYADIEGHPDERHVRLALEELQFFCSKLTVLGRLSGASVPQGHACDIISRHLLRRMLAILYLPLCGEVEVREQRERASGGGRFQSGRRLRHRPPPAAFADAHASTSPQRGR